LVRPVDIIMVKGVYEYFKRLMNTTDKLSNWWIGFEWLIWKLILFPTHGPEYTCSWVSDNSVKEQCEVEKSEWSGAIQQHVYI
jgi:hypothetical protein